MALPTNVLSLCAGGGGLDLGLRLTVSSARTVCYVENEVTAAGVLAANMATGGLDDAPLWTDLRTFDGAAWRGVVDWVIGGYPCQPFSNAGRRRGTADPRHLWPDIERIVTDVQPEFCFFENVGAHLRLGGHEVIRSLQELGYNVAATLLTAEEVGAPHKRERLFILGVDDSAGARRTGRESRESGPLRNETRGAEPRGRCDSVAHASRVVQREPHDAGRAESWRDARGDAGRDSGAVGDADQPRLEGRCEPVFGRGDELPAWPPGPADTDGWRRVLATRPDLAPAVEPPVRGVADGVSGGLGRSDQLHILGNGVVPQQAAYALRLLMETLA